MTTSTLITVSLEQLRALLDEDRRKTLEEFTAAQTDTWFGGPQAAQHVYGRPGAEEAFRGLRNRHPELDQMSVGTGKLRRWRRADLDRFLAEGKGRRRQAG